MVVWYVLALSIFLTAELIAVFNKTRGDTASEYVWRLLFHNGRPKYGIRWGFWIPAALLLAWLVPHLLFRRFVF